MTKSPSESSSHDSSGEPPRRTQITRAWSRPAAFFAGSNTLSRPKLNAVIARATKIALGAPPLYPELQKALKNTRDAPLKVECFWVDDTEIQRLNRENRGKDKPTDVLSFPLFEGEVWTFPNEELVLGDLVISIETAARQATQIRHSLECEVAFLAIHGTLHLLGYDHGANSARRKMFALQDRLFESWKAQQEAAR